MVTQNIITIFFAVYTQRCLKRYVILLLVASVSTTKATKGVTALFTRLLNSVTHAYFTKNSGYRFSLAYRQTMRQLFASRRLNSVNQSIIKPIFYCFATLLTAHKGTCFILYIGINLGQENITASAIVMCTFSLALQPKQQVD
jgi:hypothetical protein